MNIKEWEKKFDDRFVDTVCSCRSIDCPKFRGIKSFISEVYKEAWNAGRESVVKDCEGMKKPEVCPKYPNGNGCCNQIDCPYCKNKESDFKDGFNSALTDVITKLSELKEKK